MPSGLPTTHGRHSLRQWNRARECDEWRPAEPWQTLLGHLTVNGDLVLGRAGTLLIEIGGSDPAPATASAPNLNLEPTTSQGDGYFDRVNVTGKITLGGTLKVQLINPAYVPAAGTKFDIITFGNRTFLDFDNNEGLIFSDANGAKFFFKPEILSNRVTLTVTAASAAQVRPVIFIPGLGGTLAADDTPAGMEEWYLHRGIAPAKLALEPLTNVYSNIVESLVKVGYTRGVDLFVANWDWRVPVAITDNSGPDSLANQTMTNGILSLVTADSITDSTYQSGVDYLGYWLDKAVTAWSALKAWRWTQSMRSLTAPAV